MLITNLALTNYRSYSSLDLTLNNGISIFIGKNGEGKTNIAESLIYLAYLSSHRVSNNQPLISLGADQAIIRAEIESQGRTLQVDLEINSNVESLSKTVAFDKQMQTTIKELVEKT